MEDENKTPLDTDTGNSLQIGTKTQGLLAEIAKWSKFVGIVGFAMCGILLFVSLAIVFFGKEIGTQLEAVGQPASAANNMTGIVYGIIAVLYYFPARNIYDFAVYMKQAVEHNDQESIDYSFDRLRAFFKFIGMVAIVIIGFYAIAFIMALLSGVAG